MALTNEMKLAVHMGIRAGVEMALAGLEAAKRDPRGARVAPIRETLQIAIDVINKMTAEAVNDIRQAESFRGVGRMLADQNGVTEAQISRIRTGRAWR